MAGSYVSMKRELLKTLDSEMRQAVNRNANAIAFAARRLVPSPGASRGYATGALAASIHVERADDYQTAYDTAIAAAKAASDERILRRNQIQEPSPPQRRGTEWQAASVVVPLTYADLIERGFEHAGTREYIIGTRYLLSAVRDTTEDWLNDLADVMAALEAVRVPTEAELQERAQFRALRGGQSMTRRDAAQLHQEFLATIQPSDLERQKFRVVGSKPERKYSPDRKSWYLTGRQVPVYQQETTQERNERIGELKREWLALRNSGYKM